MSKNAIFASIIAVGLLAWLASGLLLGESAPAEHPPLAEQERSAANKAGVTPSRVRVKLIESEARTRFQVLRGRTESKRMVQVKAEISGKVISRPVERGTRVARGDLLCELAVDDREVAVDEAQAALENAVLEYDGSLKLKEQGLQSEIAIAGSAARQEAARAQLRRQVLNLERTRITAPFAGVVEELQMNTGDYAVPGAPCATLIDLDPMLVKADVSENEVEGLELGSRVSGETSAGQKIEGVITFVGKQSDPVTRTYPIEITVDNADYSIRSGLTVSVRIAQGSVEAHLISPALFALSDEGEIGVRTLDESNRVIFHVVKIVEDGPDGVWVSGLPSTSRLISVGQEFVTAGDIVEPVFISGAGAEVAQP